MELISEAPQLNSFVPLLEHQSATPASFHSGPPVLHYHSQRCKVISRAGDMDKSTAVQRLGQGSEKVIATNGTDPSGDNEQALSSEDETSALRTISDIDVWVTSEKLLLYSSPLQIGVSIPYPTISLHAIQSLPAPSAGEQRGLYMQLMLQSPDATALSDDDDEEDSISLTVVPQNDAPPPPTTTDPDSTTSDHSPQPPTVALFTALSNCSNLHPGPVDDDQSPTGLADSALFQAGLIAPGDTSGGLPPPMPGSGGWITAENMGEYVDEEGNWIAEGDVGQDEVLGAGAGTIRQRQSDEDGGVEANGTSDETKWRRTD